MFVKNWPAATAPIDSLFVANSMNENTQKPWNPIKEMKSNFPQILTTLIDDFNTYFELILISTFPPRFCVGDKFYLCDNKILCEYDYEERLVFASMANHPILKRHASGSLPGTPPTSIPNNNIPTSVSSPIQQNGHHHGLLSNISSPRSQNNDMNNNQNGMNGVSSPFGTPTHMKQVITTNWNQHPRWPKWNG